MNFKFTKGINDDSRFIRHTVFELEQGFKYEFDEYDDYVDTLVIYKDNTPLATGRMYEIDKSKHIFKLGRIAVLKEYRKLGLGRMIIQILEQKAKEYGAKEFYISAQCRAAAFYNSCGYKEKGECYYEEHVKHISMYKYI